ncbi:MAG: hypothetical protein L0Z55_03370 [Planctomycetes bacterium]|nr:hypothetical protein [Planctomycetota bacterium]
MTLPEGNRAESRSGLRALDLCLFVLPAAVIAFHPLANNDLPMHLAIGEWILREGSIPAADPFSFTAPPGEWVAHEWLAGVAFALVHAWAGPHGLVALAVLGAILLAALAARVARGFSTDAGELLFWVPVIWLLAGRRIMLRPHLIAEALPFLVWWILLRARGRPALLALLPLVMAFWANLHGSFYLGLAIIAADLLLAAKEHRAGWRLRLAALIGSAFALFVQPFGTAGLTEPFALTSDPVFMRFVTEWASPFGAAPGSAEFRSTLDFALSLPWLALVAIGLVVNRRGLPLSYRLFVLGTAILYVKHQRYLMLFALASLPCLPFRVPGPAWLPSLRRSLPRAIALATAAALLCFGFPERWGVTRQCGSGFAGNLPIAEVRDLAARGVSGNVLCEYDYGGVIAWASEGRLKVSMDSRNTVYGADLYLRHLAALEVRDPLTFAVDSKDLDALLSRCDAAVLRDGDKFPERALICAILDADPAWRRHPPPAGSTTWPGNTRVYLRQPR